MAGFDTNPFADPVDVNPFQVRAAPPLPPAPRSPPIPEPPGRGAEWQPTGQ